VCIVIFGWFSTLWEAIHVDDIVSERVVVVKNRRRQKPIHKETFDLKRVLHFWSSSLTWGKRNIRKALGSSSPESVTYLHLCSDLWLVENIRKWTLASPSRLMRPVLAFRSFENRILKAHATLS
jgi:hypothetical protein